jgi:hypothetical protein
MSASNAEKNSDREDSGEIVAQVSAFIAALPEKDGLQQAIKEGVEIAAIIEPLGLPTGIVAAVHA